MNPTEGGRRSRVLAILGSALFLVIAPGSVAVLVPLWISGWRLQSALFNISLIRVLGVLLIAAGLPPLLDSFRRFAVQGLGTPSPTFPTRQLVVTGLYRNVRNPMYVSVVSLIWGQGLFLGNPLVLLYGLIVALISHGFVVLYEEPTLRSTFGVEYEVFRANVPRWIPRLRPWKGP